MKDWPVVPLREVLSLDLLKERIDSSKKYEMVGVLSYGRGLFRRPAVEDGKTSYKYMLRLSAKHVVMSQLFGWEGALALSSPEFDGAYLSPNFPTFVVDESCLDRGFLGWVMQRPAFWNDLGSRAKGMGDRRRTLTPDALFQSTMPLPPLSEQRSIAARLDELSDKIRRLNFHLERAEIEADRLLAQRFREVIADAPHRRMCEVAPVLRRNVDLDSSRRYREVGARSFGKGLFVKPDFDAAEATWEKPVWIRAGDVVFSNIKAWEGAIALAGEEHEGVIASHRYITCLPDHARMLGSFLLYYLLGQDGLLQIEHASTGTADRNRTLSLKKLANIEVPVPPLDAQHAFAALQTTIAMLKARHSAIRESNVALLPATLERTFGVERI